MRDHTRNFNNYSGPQQGHGGGKQQKYGGGKHPKHSGGFHHAEPLESAIPSPYNFVPLAYMVSVDDAWTEKVSHDIPFSNGISGVLTLKLKAESPIYIRNGGAHPEDPETKLNDSDYLDFFRVYPNGPYGIPGSSIKGMIRNVVEIASFSKMALVDNYKYSIRDLNNQKHYTSKLTDSDSGAYKPRAKAGWLEDRGNGEWVLYPCEFGRVEQDELARYFGNGFTPWKRQNAIDKYKQWLRHKNLTVHCRINSETVHRKHSVPLSYCEVDQLGKGPNQGVIVMTGQTAEWSPDRPGSNRKKKHMEFVFFNTSPNALPIKQKLKDEFIFVHSEPSGEPNKEWKYWKNKMQKGERVPIFYLGNSNDPDSMGLAMMYRLAYSYSVIDAIPQEHHNTEALDFAQCLFGRVEDKTALRSRVWFRPMIIDTSTKSGNTVKTILNNPKPTYYPNYMEQNTDNSGKIKGDYQTFMDNGCKIKGWKRYPTRLQAPEPIKPAQDQERVSTAFRPLPEGTSFTGHMTIHNLRPEELGALVWAIRLGDRAGARHSLGMAKPYGYGQITLSIENTELQSNDGQKVNLEECVTAFEQKMNSYCPGTNWKDTPQIQALLEMADPNAHRPHELKYPILDMKKSNNQFVGYIKQKLALKGFPSKGSSATPKPSSSTAPKPKHNKVQGSQTNVQQGESRLDALVDRAATQPLILVDLKNAPTEFQKWIETQDKTELAKLLFEKFVEKYPEHIKRWKTRYETQQKGVFGDLKPLFEKFNVNIPD
ncbi:MAG: TIGR03986 family CRISPR-associated RAMP protein [bacterium]